jgi:hypothetical protein
MIIYDIDGNPHDRQAVDAREMIESGYYFAKPPKADVIDSDEPISVESVADVIDSDEPVKNKRRGS